MWIRWVELVIGLWLIAAPFVLGYSATAYWNDILVGLLTAVLAVMALSPRNVAHGWTGFSIGTWLLLAPFILGYSNVEAALWNDLATGLVLLIVASVIYRSRFQAEHPADRPEG